MMNDARGNEIHVGDTVVTTDRNGAGDTVLTQHVVHGFDERENVVICGMPYSAIHRSNPGANGRRHTPSPAQIETRNRARYGLAANTVYRASQP